MIGQKCTGYEVEIEHWGLLQYQRPSAGELTTPENEKRRMRSSLRLHLGQRIRSTADITGLLVTLVARKK
jgi:hypothetical protein